MGPLLEEKLAKLLAAVRSTVHRETLPIPRFAFLEGDPRGAHRPDFDDSAWAPFEVGGTWGGYDVVAWFRATVVVPEAWRSERVVLRFLVGPRDGGASTAETLLHVDGEALQGIDVWHEEAWLPPELVARGRVHVALRAWSGVLGVPERRRFRLAQLVRVDPDAEGLWHLGSTLLAAARELDPADWRRTPILRALDRALRAVDLSEPGGEASRASVRAAREGLAADVASMAGSERRKPVVTVVGHAHIDLAWLWRQHHAREKAVRTFATVLHLMRQDPEYRFLHSSPQLYAALERDEPGLFERIRERVREGRWEVTGAMWVEADTNLPSGESLIRQLLFGRRYARRAFGVEADVAWLPDAFGYSAILPQILRKAGVQRFLTTKISWNQTNRFPYDTFRWRGIDGSEVLAHFVTTPEPDSHRATYNGRLTPFEVLGSWRGYRQGDLNDELLLAFGWGDGGGGPTMGMLHAARAMRDLPGLPRVEHGHVGPFFERLERRVGFPAADPTAGDAATPPGDAGPLGASAASELPVWDGELYLEYHRGTYTSQAQVKRANRRGELLLRDAEILDALAALGVGSDAAPDLREAWELLLTNQFHDVLPGSSIGPVYADTAADHRRVAEIGEGAVADALERLAAGVADAPPAESPEPTGLLLVNTLGWPRAGVVALPWSDALEGLAVADDAGRALPAQTVGAGAGRARLLEVPVVPALGYRPAALVAVPAAVDHAEPDAAGRGGASASLRVTVGRLENAHLRALLDERGHLVSVVDRATGHEAIAPGARGNVLQAFQDRPLDFDAWDVDPFYEEVMHPVDDLTEAVVEEDGPVRATLRLTRRFRRSTVVQRLTLARDARRLEVHTEVDWHERQTLLKVAFPLRVRTRHATFDLGMGAIERPTHRNTPWDRARFEVPAHRWVDLSEGDRGVALLNDCKYGHDVHHEVVRLTLIKSPIDPDPDADRGRHAFTYALFPHAGDWRAAAVVREAHDLGLPLRHVPLPGGRGGSGGAWSLAEVRGDGIVIDTVKRAEEGDAWVVRLFEAHGARHAGARLRFGVPPRRVATASLLEEEADALPIDDASVALPLSPYEIVTLLVWF